MESSVQMLNPKVLDRQGEVTPEAWQDCEQQPPRIFIPKLYLFIRCFESACKQMTVYEKQLHAGFRVLEGYGMQYLLLPDRASSPAIPPPRLQLWIDCADKKLALKEKVTRGPD